MIFRRLWVNPKNRQQMGTKFLWGLEELKVACGNTPKSKVKSAFKSCLQKNRKRVPGGGKDPQLPAFSSVAAFLVV